jgi:hypothetical protein
MSSAQTRLISANEKQTDGGFARLGYGRGVVCVFNGNLLTVPVNNTSEEG